MTVARWQRYSRSRLSYAQAASHDSSFSSPQPPTTFLGVLTVASLVATCRNATRDNELRGLGDYTQTYGKVSGANIALAILHVLYSYHGWENASIYTLAP